MKVTVDRDLCIGISNCVGVAPTVFQLDMANKAMVMDITSVDAQTLMEAAKSCPQNAIIIEDDDGHQLYP